MNMNESVVYENDLAVTLRPETDGTFAASWEARGLVRRGLFVGEYGSLSGANRGGWILGLDPKNAEDRAEIERRVRLCIGPISCRYTVRWRR